MNLQIIVSLGVAAAIAWSSGAPWRSGPPEWTLREELRLGESADSSDDLSGIRGIAVSRRGIVHAITLGRLVVFMPDGPLSRLGVVPRLPWNETTRGFGWWRDSLWVYEPRGSVVSILGARGEVVRTLRYLGDDPPDGAQDVSDGLNRVRRALVGDTTFIALLADGSILRLMALPDSVGNPPRATMRIIPGPARLDTSVRAPVLLVRAARNGEVLQGLEILAGPWTDAQIPSPYGHVTRVPQPFQDHPLVATTPDGSEVIIVERFGAIRPGPATYSIARVDAVTGRRRSHRYEYDPEPVTEAAVDLALDRMLDSTGSPISSRFLQGFPSRAAATGALRSVLRRPSFHTPVTNVLVGGDRSVWLQERATGRWVAHTPDGRVAGRVTLPAGSTLVHADERVIWTVARAPGTPGGGQVLSRHRLIKP